MAETVKKTKAAAAPRKASVKKVKAAEVAKPTAEVPKGIELVAKVGVSEKAKTPAKLPRKTATKKENVVAISKPQVVSREMIAQVAYQIWEQRGHQYGQALEDWIQAERELHQRAS
jgi:hypothetical protein